MKIPAEDKHFSLCIRERADWKCETCGTKYERGSQGLHCSHYFSRAKKSTRWLPLNCVAHCYSCHQRLGGNPHDFSEWYELHIGTEQYLELVRLASTIMRTTVKDRKEIARHYREAHKQMILDRDCGVVGRLEFPVAELIAERLDV